MSARSRPNTRCTSALSPPHDVTFMKTKIEMDRHAAFPDPAAPPTDQELVAALGRASVAVALAIDALRAAEPRLVTAWQFSPRAGWYRIYSLKKRRLLYLVPRRRNFKVTLILGRKAVAQVQAGPLGRRLTVLLRTAQRWPEGIGFVFDRESFDPDLLAAMLAAKLAT